MEIPNLKFTMETCKPPQSCKTCLPFSLLGNEIQMKARWNLGDVPRSQSPHLQYIGSRTAWVW